MVGIVPFCSDLGITWAGGLPDQPSSGTLIASTTAIAATAATVGLT